MTGLWTGLRQLALIGLLASLPATAGHAADAGGFDIAGMRIGMSSDEVAALARSQGFHDVRSDIAPSFDQAVALQNRQRIDFSQYAGVQTLMFKNDNEEFRVSFVQTPSGSRASSISYSFFGSDVSSAQMSAQALQKYGEPDQRGSREWVWGDTAIRYARTEPFLEFAPDPASFGSVRPVGTLTLVDPSMQKQALEAIKTAAAERADGKQPTF